MSSTVTGWTLGKNASRAGAWATAVLALPRVSWRASSADSPVRPTVRSPTRRIAVPSTGPMRTCAPAALAPATCADLSACAACANQNGLRVSAWIT